MKDPHGPASPQDWQVHLALLFVQIAFGAFHVSAKYVIAFIPPLSMAGLRILLSTPLLMAIALRLDRAVPSRKDLLRLALLGMLGVFANQIFYILGLQHTTAINAGVLMPTIPVFVAGLAILLRMEQPSWVRLAGVGLAVVGAGVMLDFARISLGGGPALRGNGLILLNCLCYALYLVLLRPVLTRVPPLTVIAWVFLFGGAATVLVSVPSLLRTDFGRVPTAVWGILLFIAVIPTAVNYALNTWAIRHSSPTLVATYTTLQPIAAALLAMPLLGETAGWREAVGFLLIVAGLAAVSRASFAGEEAGECK